MNVNVPLLYGRDWRVCSTEWRREMRELGIDTWRGRQEPAGDLGHTQRTAVDRGFRSRVTRASRSPTSSFQHANHGRLTHTGSRVVSNNLPLIIRVCALLLWFGLHAWLETCRQSLFLSLSLSPSFLSCATKCDSECNQTWDEELATVAQRLAEQCLFEHDCNECRKVGKFSLRIRPAINAIFPENINAKRVVTVRYLSPTFRLTRWILGVFTGRFPVGQNLAVEWTTGPPLPINWKKQVTRWYEEVEEFPNTSARKFE